ncbi:MAG TPA: hypothetical protein PLH23_16195 [Hyphomonadaceae bacterium]|jgi:hypothetical protein|nr:hypothetical protein [Hyphomonadaceae bacterium]HPI49814.1 hypothetical protein [Hyphomonadaceae bacterium]
MAKKPTARVEFAFFNVTYEDGSQRSNRKVSADVLNAYDKDAAIREAIEAQDKAISEKSGLPPLAIKSISPSK